VAELREVAQPDHQLRRRLERARGNRPRQDLRPETITSDVQFNDLTVTPAA
jgi:hypothetical protein